MVRVRLSAKLGTFVLPAAAAACVHVAPYERGAIARPDMTLSDLMGPAQKHATEVHEGATHGGAAAEAGCGCN